MNSDFRNGMEFAFFLDRLREAVGNYISEGVVQDAERVTLQEFRAELEQTLDYFEKLSENVGGWTSQFIPTALNAKAAGCRLTDRVKYLLFWVQDSFEVRLTHSGLINVSETLRAGREALNYFDLLIDGRLGEKIAARLCLHLQSRARKPSEALAS